MKTITLFNVPVSVVSKVINAMETMTQQLILEGEYKEAREVLYSLEEIKKDYERELIVLASLEAIEEPIEKQEFEDDEV